MHPSLKNILSIQELDIKMIRLLRIKQQRLKELEQLAEIRSELVDQLEAKKEEIATLNAECFEHEKKIEEHEEKLKKLDSQQSSIKKIDEFNALAKEVSSLERTKTAIEHTLSNLVDQRAAEEELFNKTKQSLKDSEESSKKLEIEILATIQEINAEGRELKKDRELLAAPADGEILKIYERLLKNKKDRVVVPLENRACSGCHISLTAQHENLVRKGEKLVFCEHCSRILYWTEDLIEDEAATAKRRRRRAVSPQ
jgi:predicted  nucleic acid-binding Zn-ribbon protein